MPTSFSILLFTLCLGLAACGNSDSTTDPAGAAGAAGSGAAGSGAAGSGGDGAGGSAAGAGGGSSSGTTLTGTLGALGAVKPTVSSLVISNSGETLIYMSSAPITCQMLQVSRWLGSAQAGSQVVEIVIKGAPKVGETVTDATDGEVNYAAGGKSSSYEVNAKTDTITFTKAEAKGVVEGTVAATYDDGSTISGSFHAEFCDMGQGF
jgi:hypothetical protein